MRQILAAVLVAGALTAALWLAGQARGDQARPHGLTGACASGQSTGGAACRCIAVSR